MPDDDLYRECLDAIDKQIRLIRNLKPWPRDQEKCFQFTQDQQADFLAGAISIFHLTGKIDGLRNHLPVVDHLTDEDYHQILDPYDPPMHLDFSESLERVHCDSVSRWLNAMMPFRNLVAKLLGNDSRSIDEQSDDLVAELQPLEKALALLVNHPTWSDADIASAVGVNRTTLYKPSWKKYRQAKEAMKSAKSESPRGYKNSKTGDIDAWDGDTLGNT